MRARLFSKVKNTGDYGKKEFPRDPIFKWKGSNFFSKLQNYKIFIGDFYS
jgi:hypothetical protein